MSLIRRERRQWEPEPIVPAFPGADGGSGSGNPSMSRALQVSAVWACVRLIADSVSMMPVQSYTMKGSVRVPTPPPAFVLSPSVDATMPEWIYMVLVSLLLRGNCYGRIVRTDGYGYPLQVELLNPDSVRCTTNAAGVLTYAVNGVDVPASQIQHIRAFRMPGQRTGLSPIQYAARQVNTELAVGDFAYGFFRDGAHPSSVLSSDLPMTQEQAATAKNRFITAIKGREPAMLSGGIKYTQVQVSPNESQFLETQKYGVAEIARIFGVPPEMIAGEAGNSMTYANVEQRGIDFLTYTIQPWLTRLEAALAGMFPGPRHLRFDTSVLTRTDYETTMKATAIGIASKQMDPDEARAKRDEPPLTDEQKAWLDIIPLEVSPTGLPKAVPVLGAPAEGEPA